LKKIHIITAFNQKNIRGIKDKYKKCMTIYKSSSNNKKLNMKMKLIPYLSKRISGNTNAKIEEC